jgi:hypothetical protein
MVITQQVKCSVDSQQFQLGGQGVPAGTGLLLGNGYTDDDVPQVG